MNSFSVIMAGGGGTRFWPLSRQDMPKQLLNLSGNDALINETISRFKNMMPISNVFIVTTKQQADMMKPILPGSFPDENILREPIGRNTAPCILFAAMHIYERYGDGVLCILPSDHYITKEKEFLTCLNNAMQIADETGAVVTIGVKPTFPATGYGYIKREDNALYTNAYRIDKFIEKPNFDKAAEYFNSDLYYWNSGMFVWKISSIIKAYERFLPRIYRHLKSVCGKFLSPGAQGLIDAVYPLIDNISVDYGIMERIEEAIVIPGDFGWNDIGSWDALGAIFPRDRDGNIIKGEHICLDTKECIIYGGGNKIIATIGVSNAIIVNTDDAILFCAKDRAQDVKYIVDEIKRQEKTEYV